MELDIRTVPPTVRSAISGLLRRIESVAEHPKPTACPGCWTRNSQLIFQIPEVPANCSALWQTSPAARNCLTGPIELRACACCGLVFNARFDGELVKYDANYDNSLDFSPAFQAYASALAGRLVDTYQLHRKRIVEIGCGEGTFLKLLCSKGNNTGTGYDPSFRWEPSDVPGVCFVNRYFDWREAERGFDFLCCRHVLEHFDKPLEFLRELSRMTSANPGAILYFEVPNGNSVLGGDSLWDVVYPHVSYFTETSLRTLFERAGFEVLQVGNAFSDQFLFIEARRNPHTLHWNMRRHHADFSADVSSFGAHFERAIRDWAECIQRLMASRGQFAFWGAGAKGVTFLNVVPGAQNISHVIDSNPRKQQTFVPGTGQRICSPESLHEILPSAVILLNDAYRQEIAGLLSSQGVKAQIVTQPSTLV